MFFVLLLVLFVRNLKSPGVLFSGTQSIPNNAFAAYYKEIEQKLTGFEYKSTKSLNGTLSTKVGSFDYDIKNLDLSGLSLKSFKADFEEGFFSFELSSITAKLGFDYSIKEKSWPHESYAGSGDAECDVGISFHIKPFVGPNYVLQVTVSEVQLVFNSFDINLTGIPYWLKKILDVLKSTIQKTIESQVEEKVPTIVDSIINKKLVEIGNTIHLPIPQLSSLGLNISVFDIDLKSQKVHIEDFAEVVTFKSAPKFPNVPAPMSSKPFSTDLEVSISQFTLDSALFSAHYSNLIQFYVDKDTIPEEYAEKLNTNYFKEAIPILYKDYPNKPLYVNCQTNKPPYTEIKYTTSAVSLDLDCSYFIGELPPRNDDSLFTLGIHSKFNWTYSIEQATPPVFHWVVSMEEYNLTLAKVGSIGKFDPTAIEALLGNDFRKYILPYVNKFGETGYPLSFKKIGIDLDSPSLTNMDGYFSGNTNLKISPIPIPVRQLHGLMFDVLKIIVDG